MRLHCKLGVYFVFVSVSLPHVGCVQGYRKGRPLASRTLSDLVVVDLSEPLDRGQVDRRKPVRRGALALELVAKQGLPRVDLGRVGQHWELVLAAVDLGRVGQH